MLRIIKNNYSNSNNSTNNNQNKYHSEQELEWLDGILKAVKNEVGQRFKTQGKQKEAMPSQKRIVISIKYYFFQLAFNYISPNHGGRSQVFMDSFNVTESKPKGPSIAMSSET